MVPTTSRCSWATDGSFQGAQSFDAGNHPISVAVGDLNADGAADLAVVNYRSAGTVSVLLETGMEAFSPRETLARAAFLSPWRSETSTEMGFQTWRWPTLGPGTSRC